MNSTNYILVTCLSDIESNLFFAISAWFWLTYSLSSIGLYVVFIVKVQLLDVSDNSVFSDYRYIPGPVPLEDCMFYLLRPILSQTL